jgi:hypothetical protein
MAKTAEVERDGTRVTIRVQCTEVYEAMHLYDQLNASLAIGSATIVVTTRRARAIIEGEKRAR